jgi:hypothetical protein
VAIIISASVRLKLANKHRVSEREVREVFNDQPDYVLLDEREDHASDPPTVWFIASTYSGRQLKVCYIETETDVIVRTAYEPNADELRIFLNAAP